MLHTIVLLVAIDMSVDTTIRIDTYHRWIIYPQYYQDTKYSAWYEYQVLSYYTIHVIGCRDDGRWVSTRGKHVFTFVYSYSSTVHQWSNR